MMMMMPPVFLWALVASVIGLAADPPPPPPPVIAAHSLAEISPDAVCVDGSPAAVSANASTGSSTTWVIQIGPGNGGAGLFCWHDPKQPPGQLWDCQTAAKPKATPAPPASWTSLGAGEFPSNLLLYSLSLLAGLSQAICE